MDKPKKAFFIMLAVLAVTIIGGGGGFYLTDQALQKKSSEISQLRADQALIDQQITIYEDAKKKIEELAFIEDLANQVLPQDKEQGEVIAEIRTFAEQAGMPIASITFSGATTSTGAAGLATSQTDAVEGLTGVRVLPAELSFTTSENAPSYNQVIGFLQKIETNRRKMQITDITLSPNPLNPNLISSISISVNIYLKG